MKRNKSIPAFYKTKKDANIFFVDNDNGLIKVGNNWIHVTGITKIDCTGMIRYIWDLSGKMQNALLKYAIQACEALPDRKQKKRDKARYILAYTLAHRSQRKIRTEFFYAPVIPAATIGNATKLNGYNEAVTIAESLFAKHNVHESDKSDNTAMNITDIHIITFSGVL